MLPLFFHLVFGMTVSVLDFQKVDVWIWCRMEFINIFVENENRKDVQNNTEAAPFN
jgi:hypothetical protein